MVGVAGDALVAGGLVDPAHHDGGHLAAARHRAQLLEEVEAWHGRQQQVGDEDVGQATGEGHEGRVAVLLHRDLEAGGLESVLHESGDA